MTIPRGLSVVHNTGTYNVLPTNRSMFAAENVGVSDEDVAARSLSAPVNVGVSDEDVDGRALYEMCAVTENSGEATGLQLLLIGTDFSVQRVLTGK